MTTVFDVAKYILEKRGVMTTMKLQKLCYYAQAWNVTWTDKPLFNEEFQAWSNGPVCPNLYYEHRGKFYISKEGLRTFFEVFWRFACILFHSAAGRLDSTGAAAPTVR